MTATTATTAVGLVAFYRFGDHHRIGRVIADHGIGLTIRDDDGIDHDVLRSRVRLAAA